MHTSSLYNTLVKRNFTSLRQFSFQIPNLNTKFGAKRLIGSSMNLNKMNRLQNYPTVILPSVRSFSTLKGQDAIFEQTDDNI